MIFQSLTRAEYRAPASPAPVALMFFCLFALAGCGGGGGSSGGGASVEMQGPAADDRIANVMTERTGGIGIQARAAARNAPKQGSVTQSSNGNSNPTTPTTTDTVDITTLRRDVDGAYTFTLMKTSTDTNVMGWSLDNSDIEDDEGDDEGHTFFLTKRFGDSTQAATDDGTLYADFSTDIRPESADGTPDTDWLAGGLWLYLPDDDQLTSVADAENIEIGAYVDGGDPFSRTRLAGLTSTATYSGDADGVYVEVGDATSDDLDGEIDTFEGALSLTAEFGSSSERGSIHGVLTNIHDGDDQYQTVEDDEHADYNPEDIAMLTFGRAMITDTIGGFFTGDLSGRVDSIDYDGKWGGQFFGNGDAATDHPAFVAGTFGGTGEDNINMSVLTFIGLFGLERDESSP